LHKVKSVSRRAILAIAILAMAGAGWWWWQTRTPPPAEWQGYADADFVKVSPVFEGVLTSLYVERGAKVACGEPLFDQDDTAERAALDQAARQLTQAERQLTNLESASKPTEIVQAEANLAQAQADRDKIQTDLDRYEGLLKSRAVPAQLVDQTRDNLRAANAKVEGLEAALAQMRGPFGREPQIRAQQAAVGAARAAVAATQWRFDQRHVTAPAAGVIADVLARPGETVPAGGPVVSLLPPENIFVRFFVPEPMLAEVHYGEKVKLICDSCPAGLTATISFISPQAEYTPPVIYSESSRAKLLYRVEARPPAQEAPLLNPGEPVAVRPIAKDRQR
jgi:HlyD family secretion protein